MEAIHIAQSYFAAWNRHDSTAISALFTEGGTYRDPVVAAGLTGTAIAEYARGLFTAFPDLTFEVVSAAPAGAGTVAAQWMMRGANTGPFTGTPPTGRTVALPGADFITVDGEKIRTVQGYFDQRTLTEQLGLQVLVQPYALGPVSFGRSKFLQCGKRKKPGAFSLTAITLGSEADKEELEGYGPRILPELAQMPGFISALTAGPFGHRAFTIAAWEDAESPRQMLQGRAHKEAMGRFFGGDFAVGVMTSVWVPQRINPLWVRCRGCGRVVDVEKVEGKCQCGQPLPEPPPYW